VWVDGDGMAQRNGYWRRRLWDSYWRARRTPAPWPWRPLRPATVGFAGQVPGSARGGAPSASPSLAKPVKGKKKREPQPHQQP